MGLFGKIGKFAGFKVVEKVEGEIAKKQNSEQTSRYCVYIRNNIIHASSLLINLQKETQSLIDEINAKKVVKLSFKEKWNLGKVKDKAHKNLEYLYLSRDFFVALSKNASGIELQREEILLVFRFAPYFDGIPVLDVDYEESDDSIMGELKEIGKEILSEFVSLKKDANRFDFDDYLYRYDEQICDFIIPDIDSAIESFKKATGYNDIYSALEETYCSNCHAKVLANSKFCPECGNNLDINKVKNCLQCGETIVDCAKFCANCGAKII